MPRLPNLLAFAVTLGFSLQASAWSYAWTDVWYELQVYEQNALVADLPFTHVQSHSAPVSTFQSIGSASLSAYAAPGLLRADVWAATAADPAPYPTPVQRSSQARTGASFFDQLTIVPSDPALLGKDVTVYASWIIDGGMLGAFELSSNLPATANARAALSISGTGMGTWPVQAREQQGYRSGILYAISEPAPALIPVAITAILGSPTAIQYAVQLDGLAEVGFLKEECATSCAGSHANAEIVADYAHSFRWGGINSVTDANGNPLEGFSVLSDSGFDYAVAVPEPGAGIHLLGGLGLLGVGLRRRTPL